MSALRKGAGGGCLNTTDWQGGTADLDIVVESLATTFTFYHIHLCLHRRVFECGFKTNNNDMSVRFSFFLCCYFTPSRTYYNDILFLIFFYMISCLIALSTKQNCYMYESTWNVLNGKFWATAPTIILDIKVFQ